MEHASLSGAMGVVGGIADGRQARGAGNAAIGNIGPFNAAVPQASTQAQRMAGEDGASTYIMALGVAWLLSID
jgi:hypothetical protein